MTLSAAPLCTCGIPGIQYLVTTVYVSLVEVHDHQLILVIFVYLVYHGNETNDGISKSLEVMRNYNVIEIF